MTIACYSVSQTYLFMVANLLLVKPITLQLLVIISNLCLFLLILLSYQCYLYSIEKVTHSHISSTHSNICFRIDKQEDIACFSYSSIDWIEFTVITFNLLSTNCDSACLGLWYCTIFNYMGLFGVLNLFW